LAHGATIVLNVDPVERIVRLSSNDGERVLDVGDVIEHPTFPGLHILVATIFVPLDELI